MGPGTRPDAEVEVDAALAVALVRDQHPDLIGPVEPAASGWDNVMFRLGDELAVRLPRRRLGADLLRNELRWLPELARSLRSVPLALPVPVREGRPSSAYPFPWSIARWVPGETALRSTVPLDGPAVVVALTGFLRAMWSRPAPALAPRNPFRGVALAERSAMVEERIDRLPGDLDRHAVVAAWARDLAVPSHAGPPAWVHGDLHPGNLVVHDAHLVGVVDWGDLCAGDPATDLSVAWMVLGPRDRATFRRATSVDGATWARARGNALAHAVAVLAHSADDPRMEAMARRTLDAVVSDEG